jgi:SulP family sulfate permease
MGTVVNIQSGGRTALSGLIRAAILIAVMAWAAQLTAMIPLAVLAGIAFKVGVDIIDWKFLKRAHLISGKGALITYCVILLTVFVDLIAAVGIGLFVANIITVTRLAELQEDDVIVSMNPKEENIELTPYERDLMEASEGSLILLYMRGAMIFGASRAIGRRNSEIHDCRALIIDLSDVIHLGVSSALQLEEAILDMRRANRSVYIVGMQGQVHNRLMKMGMLDMVPPENIVSRRTLAFERAIYGRNTENDAREIADLPLRNQV